MLQAIRERAQGIVAWVMLIMIGVPFALWGIQNYFDSSKEQPVATVGKRDIFERDVNRVHEQNLANLVGLDEINEEQLKREALEKLVREEMLTQLAEQKKLVVSDDDVREFIQTLPYFQTEGKFDKEKYRIMLSSQGMTQESFIPQVRKALILEQFQRGVMDSAFVAPNETNSMVRIRNQAREVDTLTLMPEKATTQYKNVELEDYLKTHPGDFQIPEEVSIEYVAVSLAEIAKAITVSDEELHKLYEEQKALYTTDERRRVSHILIPVEDESPEQDKIALTKAQAIRERIAKGEDFSKLAKENSGDPLSAQKGGDLGIITPGSMDAKFSDVAFGLALGVVSEPVRTSFGYHLVKALNIQAKQIQPFESVKAELTNNYQRNAAENEFYEQGQKLTQLGFEHPDSLEQAARMLNLKIQETSAFTHESGKGIAEHEEIRKAAFSEDVLNGRNSEPVELDNELAVILRLKTHEPARNQTVDEARDAIISRMHAEETSRQALQKAMSLMVEIKAGKSMSELSKGQKGISFKKIPALKRDSTEYPPELVEAIFNTPLSVEGKAVVRNVELENGSQGIFQITSQKTDLTPDDQVKQEQTAHDLMTKSEGQRELAAWVAQSRQTFDIHIKGLPKNQQDN